MSPELLTPRGSPGTDSVLHVRDILSPLASVPLLTGQPFDHPEPLQPELASTPDRLSNLGAQSAARGDPRQASHERLRMPLMRSPLLLVGGWVSKAARSARPHGRSLALTP